MESRKRAGFYKSLLIAALTTTCAVPAIAGTRQATMKRTGTVRMDLRDNRVFVNLTVTRPNGTVRDARFVVDTGGGAVILSASLVRDLGLKVTGPAAKDEGSTFQPVGKPTIQIDEMPLDLSGVPVVAATGLNTGIMPGMGAEGFLPARVLKRYEVVFDYPAKTFTMAQPGTLKPRGTPVPSPIQPKSGFPRIELTVGGQKYGFLLDTGGAYTMISQTTIDKWRAANPTWPHSTGAVGAANMIGGSFDVNAELLRIPTLQWGQFDLREVGAVSRPPGTFETWMSKTMTAPIVGSLAGNALRAFRVEIDYAHGVTYLEKRGAANPHERGVVGIIIQAHPDGGYAVSGVAKKDGKSVVDDVEPGDKLLRVDNLDCTGASLADVLRALRGKPGRMKALVLERKGKQLTVKAPATRLP